MHAGGFRELIEGRLRARPLPEWSGVISSGRHRLAVRDGGRAILAVPPLRPGDGAVPLVVMLHGSGGDAEQSIDILGDEAARRCVVVLAPKSRDYTWDALVGGFGPDVEVIDEALAEVFVRCPIDPGSIAVAGFSDGASYALSLGLANGDLFTQVLAFSPGFTAPPMIVGRPRIFVSHGVADRVLPIDRTSRRLVPSLQEGGYEVSYEEFADGHTIPSEVVRRAMERVTGSTGQAAAAEGEGE